MTIKTKTIQAAAPRPNANGAPRAGPILAPCAAPEVRGRLISGLSGRLFAVVFVALLPVFAVVLYAGYTGREAAQRQAEDHALTLTRETAEQEARMIGDTRAVMEVLGQMPNAPRTAEPCHAFMLPSALALHSVAAIGITDSSGQVLCSLASPNERHLNVPAWLPGGPSLRQQRFSIRYFYGTGVSARPALMAVYALGHRRTRSPRILFAVMRLNWLDAIVAGAHLPTGSVFAAFDSDGHVFARYIDGRRDSSDPEFGTSTLQQLATWQSGQAKDLQIKGRQWLVTDAALGNSASLQHLHMAAAIPAAMIYAATNHSLYRELTILGVLGICSLLLAWRIGNRLMLRPIQNLVCATRRIEAGDLGARAAISAGPNEIRSLGRAFDNMAASLERRIEHSSAQSARIARLNRIHQVLSAINGAIMRIRDREQLLQEACRIAVELGHFPFAWIGWIDPGTGILHPVAHAGTATDFVRNVRVTVSADKPEGRGLMGQTVRLGMHTVSNDAQSDPRLSLRREQFKALNIHSAAAFPLRIQRRVVGALALHAEEYDFFDDEELALLDGLAADTSLGLEHIDKDRQLNYLAYWDPLTDLPNRKLFEDRLGQSLRRAERSGGQAVVFAIEIANFARINDTKGRAVGDRVLQTVATRLAGAVRDSDSLGDLGSVAARLASHEFALVLDDVPDLVLVGKVTDRIMGTLAEPISVENDELAITIRVGASVYPHDGVQPEDLLHKAQFALHSHGEDPRGHLAFYSREKDTAANARYDLEMDLYRAMENEEFYLEYQPRVDARTGRLTGAEALLRWVRPGHGNVPPDQFVPLLEETGLIAPVGEWVARTALAQRLAWKKVVQETFVISINASSHELRTPNYASRMQRLVQALEVHPNWFEIEITETGLMETGNTTLEVLTALKALGFRLSIDDFGTGYSSLSYLRQFPVDVLKIDRSFVRDIERDPEALSIVRSIMALAKALQLTTVAEGVETKQQLHLLAAEGCQEIQGYYFSRPISAEQLQHLAKTDPPFQI